MSYQHMNGVGQFGRNITAAGGHHGSGGSRGNRTRHAGGRYGRFGEEVGSILIYVTEGV